MARKSIDLLDPQTGEVQRGYVFWAEDRPNKLVGGFFVGFQEAFKALASDNDLTPQAQRVFIYLLGVLDFDNFIHIKQKEIGEALNISPGNLSRAMAILKRKEIIIIAPYKGVRCYKLNHFYGWKGSVTTLKKQETKPKLKLIKTD